MGRAEVVKTADPLDSVTVEVMAPTVKVTLPVGVPEFPVTVAVKLTA